jgi:DNA modification methylase
MEEINRVQEPDQQLYLFAGPANGRISDIPIDSHFSTTLADEMAQLESYNKNLYRPNTYLHKWWARRCGSTFRFILKHLVDKPNQQDYYTPGGLDGKIILDPMMGGGTTLHEAIRLGANVIGADIDPIPVLQARASLSEVSIKRLESAYQQFYDYLYGEIAHLYRVACPSCDKSYSSQFILYGLRRRCSCHEAIFVDSYILRHNSDGSTIKLCADTFNVLQDEQVISKSSIHQKIPLLEKGIKTCSTCGAEYQEDITVPYYQRYVPLVAVGECKGHGLFFRAVGDEDLAMIEFAEQRRICSGFQTQDFLITPGAKSQSLINRGITHYLDLFSSRQLLYLQKTIEYLTQLDTDPVVRLNLALLVSTSIEFNSMLCGYKGVAKNRPGAIRHTFAHHAYSFPYTALENNPVYQRKTSGTLQNLFYGRLMRGRKWAQNPIERRIQNGKVAQVTIRGEEDSGVEVHHFTDFDNQQKRFMLIQGSSANLDLPDNSVDFVVTDPPYFDSVQYGDLAAFFRAWLRYLVPTEAVWDYHLDDAAIDQHTNGNGQYTKVLSDIFSECQRVLKPGGRLIFTFHHWNPKGWANLTVALKQAGFRLVNRYIVHAENPSSVHIANQNSLVHDAILVLASEEFYVEPKWCAPKLIDKSDSYLFCLECSTLLGWALEQELQETEVMAIWLQALA